MDKLKLEDFMCGDANCLKIPNPGDKIYSCSASYDQGVTFQWISGLIGKIEDDEIENLLSEKYSAANWLFAIGA